MLQELLNDHIMDPKNPDKIFKLASEYDRLEQGAMAVSLYLKTADLSDNTLLQYKSLLGIAKCYWRQGNRTFTVESSLLDACGVMPELPEAHYFLSLLYAEQQKWKSSYLHARLGLRGTWTTPDLGVGYPGRNALAWLEARGKWRVAGTQEGKHKLFDLKFKTILDDEHKELVDNLLSSIYYPDTIPYSVLDKERFKFPFPDFDTIGKNYSKHFQDLFVLSMFKGKTKGTYLEIGSGDPFIHNNTALLEEWGWKGISVDNSQSLCYNFKENRNNTIICADATEIGWVDLFNKHCLDPVIDYLQIDCDEASLGILEDLPLKGYKFGVITFEHDSYRLGTEIRDKARALLHNLGYVLVVNDVAFTEEAPYEDWYAHPDVVNIPSEMETNKAVNFVWDYFMEPLTEKNQRKI